MALKYKFNSHYCNICNYRDCQNNCTYTSPDNEDGLIHIHECGIGDCIFKHVVNEYIRISHDINIDKGRREKLLDDLMEIQKEITKSQERLNMMLDKIELMKAIDEVYPVGGDENGSN